MYFRRRRLDSGEHIDHGWQRIEFDSRPGDKIFRGRAGLGQTDRDGFAHKPKLAGREMGIIRRLVTRVLGDNVDRLHTACRHVVCREDTALRAGGLRDAQVGSMRNRAADNRRFQRPRQVYIGNITPGAFEKPLVFLAQDVCADPLTVCDLPRSAVCH